MSISDRINQISKFIDEIDELSNIEYKRTLEIYENPAFIEEYKKLLYNGAIQILSILVLREVKNTLLSLHLREKALKLIGSPEILAFYQPTYFEKNAYFQLNAAWNKIAALLKVRFLKPDDHFGAEISRVVKAAKKDPNYNLHYVKKIIDKIRGNNDFKLFMEMRQSAEHGLDPDYLYGYHGKFGDIYFFKIIDLFVEIVENIYKEHLTYTPVIDNEDMDKYKIKEIIPYELKALERERFYKDLDFQKIRVRDIINTTLNYFDILIPWLNNENQKSKLSDLTEMTMLLTGILNDIAFRCNDVTRSFGGFLATYLNHYDGIPSSIVDIFKEVHYSYFMNMTCVRSYSIWDKIGLFFSRTFSTPKDKTYFKNISEWIIANASSEYKDLIMSLRKIMQSDFLNALDLIRQQYIHGSDLSLKQYEGTIISDDYFLVSLHYSIQKILDITEYLQNDFFPSEMRKMQFNIFGGYLEGYPDVIYKVRYTKNPNLPELIDLEK